MAIIEADFLATDGNLMAEGINVNLTVDRSLGKIPKVDGSFSQRGDLPTRGKFLLRLSADDAEQFGVDTPLWVGGRLLCCSWPTG